MRFSRLLKGFVVCTKYLALYPFVAPRKAGRFLWTTGHTILSYDHAESGAQINQETLEGVFPGIERIEVVMADASHADGNVSMQELYSLCAIARYRQVRCAFEIGTFNGLVTAHLARNTDPSARLLTLDFRSADLPTAKWALAPGEQVYVQKAVIGEKIQQLPDACRVKVLQLYGDSAQFDFSPYYGQVDFVVIDGSHAYRYVAHDSEEAFRLRSPTGLILWHDYLVWPGVTRYLNQLRHRHPLVHLAGTSLVLTQPS